MKSLLFIAIVIISGAAAGLIHGTVNLVIVEPYLDIAINIENQGIIRDIQRQASNNENIIIGGGGGEGENEGSDNNNNNNNNNDDSKEQTDDTINQDIEIFWNEYHSYRNWQKGGQVLAGVLLGVAMGSLFGIVFVQSRKFLQGLHDIKKAVVLAGIMWCVIYFVPFLKYPSNPPTVGDPDTIVLRTVLYIIFVAVSGFGAVLFYQLAKRIQNQKRRTVTAIAIGGYIGFMTIMFVVMPPNPDPVDAPADLVEGFRIASVLGVVSFWVSVGVIFGTLWRRFEVNLG